MVNIITKYVEIPNSRVYPKEIIGTIQHISMLVKKSSMKVEVQCDNCKNIFKRSYVDIYNLKRYVCRQCSYKLRKGVSNKKNKGNIPWNKGKKKFLDDSSLKSMKSKLKGREVWNKGKVGVQEAWNKGLSGMWSDEQIENNKFKNTYYLSDYQNKYPLFCKIEELKEHPETKEIQGRCKNLKCKNSKEKGGWFNLTKDQINTRLWSIYHNDGGSYYYCSEKCKQECPLFGKTAKKLIKEDQIRVGIIPEDNYTTSEYNTWREEVFRLDEGLCIYCGEKAEHCHHIEPQKLQPGLALDPANGISVCKECHYKYGHKDECSTGNLAQIICK